VSIERKRTENVSNQVRNRGMDALLIFSPQNIRYLTAFSQACEVAIIPAKGEPTVLGLWLDVASAKDSTWIKDVRSFIPRYSPRVDGGRNELMRVAEIVRDRGLSKGVLGVEMGHTRCRQLELLRSDLPGAKLVDVSGMLAEMRIVKSVEEIDLIRRSIKIAEEALDAAWLSLPAMCFPVWPGGCGGLSLFFGCFGGCGLFLLFRLLCGSPPAPLLHLF